jgi:hypothetical protein
LEVLHSGSPMLGQCSSSWHLTQLVDHQTKLVWKRAGCEFVLAKCRWKCLILWDSLWVRVHLGLKSQIMTLFFLLPYHVCCQHWEHVGILSRQVKWRVLSIFLLLIMDTQIRSDS